MVYCFLAAESIVVNLFQLAKVKKYINKMIYSLYTAKNSKIEPYKVIFLYKNGNFGEYFKTKSDQNILQNAPNCFSILNFLVGTYLRTTIIASAQY